jgi:hypothetical protein
MSEVRVGYGISIKANLGDYESTEARWYEERLLGVEGKTDAEVDALCADALAHLAERLDTQAEQFYADNSKNAE